MLRATIPSLRNLSGAANLISTRAVALKFHLWMFAVFAVTGFTGCTTQLTSQRSISTVPSSAFGYFLPREVYSITVTYQLVSCPDFPTILNKINAPVIKQTAVVTPIDIADSAQHFHITYSTMDSDWKNTAFQAALYPNQTLKSVGVSIASQAGQVASNLVSGGLAIAKLAAAAPAGALTCRREITEQFKTQQILAAQLSAFSVDADPKKPGKPLIASGDRSAAADIATRLTIPTITQTFVFNPQAITDSKTFVARSDDFSKWFSGNYLQSPLDELLATTVVIAPPLVTAKSATTPPTNEDQILGVVYRDPIPVLVRVCAGNGKEPSGACNTDLFPSDSALANIIGSQFVSVPQFGPFIVMPLKNTSFDNNNLAIAFASNGVPCAVAYATQSRALQISSIVTAAGSGGGSSSGSSSASKSSGGNTTGDSSKGSGKDSSGNQGQSSGASSPTAPSVTCSSTQ